jgi:hypothetical protein
MMPLDSSQLRLLFLPVVADRNVLSATNSNGLSTLQSSQFEGLNNPILQPHSAPPARARRGRNTSTKKKERTSWIYNHMPDDNPGTKYFNSDGRLEWRCQYYPTPKTYLLSGDTGVISTHLIDSYSLERTSARDKQVKNQQMSIQEALTDAAHRPQKRQRLYDRQSEESLDGTVLEILWVSVLAACSLTLRLIYLPQVRAFL